MEGGNPAKNHREKGHWPHFKKKCTTWFLIVGSEGSGSGTLLLGPIIRRLTFLLRISRGDGGIIGHREMPTRAGNRPSTDTLLYTCSTRKGEHSLVDGKKPTNLSFFVKSRYSSIAATSIRWSEVSETELTGMQKSWDLGDNPPWLTLSFLYSYRINLP